MDLGLLRTMGVDDLRMPVVGPDGDDNGANARGGFPFPADDISHASDRLRIVRHDLRQQSPTQLLLGSLQIQMVRCAGFGVSPWLPGQTANHVEKKKEASLH